MRVAPLRRGESVLDRGRKSESAHMNTAHGMTVLVTGATDGVGRLVAKQVAAAAANVIVHGRNPTKGEQTVRDIRREIEQAKIEFRCADLASLEDVRQLARSVANAHEHIDVLIKCSWVMYATADDMAQHSRTARGSHLPVRSKSGHTKAVLAGRRDRSSLAWAPG